VAAARGDAGGHDLEGLGGGGGGDPDQRKCRHGYMLVVEPGDTVQTIERQSGIAVLTDLFGETCFGDPEFPQGPK